jgi:hypothetical protein
MRYYIVGVILVCHLSFGKPADMRTVPFREVLHGVAYKMGLDPDQSNFLTNQAIPIGTYIDQWVRRTYDIRDWPEWVVTYKFAPTANHIVPWDATSVDPGLRLQIGRVLKVYLIDPKTTDAPVDTPFTLKDEGIHVGYEHGTYVWIKFMAPPPRYTAVQWRSDNIFAKDDVTYSYTTGQVYKSKSNGNIGHDPAVTFSRPPIPHVIEPEPPSPSPDIETTQPWIADNSGIPTRDKILRIYLLGSQPGPDPVDPPPANTAWDIQVTADDGVTVLGAAAHVATGAESLVTILGDLFTQLSGGLVGFTVTQNTTDLTIDLQAPSNFGFTTPYGFAHMTPPTGLPESDLKIGLVQSYIPTFSAASGQPQITRISMTDESTVPGSVYTMTVTGTDSEAHTVSYTSQSYDSAAQILQGLLMAAEASTDVFWETVEFTFDPSAATLDIIIRQPFSVDAVAPPPGSSWWELVPFPRAIADQVITGALGDLLNEWGQFDKGAMVQQSVPAESEISATDFTPTPSPPLTTQQKPMSRYQLQP